MKRLLFSVRGAWAVLALVLSLPALTAETIVDNFTNPAMWSTPTTSSAATTLSVAGGRMNYLTTSVANEGAVTPWSGSTLPIDRNWSAQVDMHVSSFTLTTVGQFVDLFLGVGRTGDWIDTHVTWGFEYGNWGGSDQGYSLDDDVRIAGTDAPSLLGDLRASVADIALKISYNAAAHTITYLYDANGATGGYTWTPQGTINIANGTYNLGLTASDTLTLILVGSSEFQTATAGAAYLSNLRVEIDPATTTPSDEQQIRDLFASLKSRLETHDLVGLMALFAPDYVHYSRDLAVTRSDLAEILPSVLTFNYTIDRIEISGNSATVHASCDATLNNGEAPAWTEPDTKEDSNGFGWLTKTASGWKVHGNQRKATVHLATGHNLPQTGYFYRLRTESALPIASVTVTGPNIPATPLAPNAEWGGFTAIVTPSAYPPLGTAYSFDIRYADGTGEIVQDTVKSWIADAPAPTVTETAGLVTIRWNDLRATVPEIDHYWVIVRGDGVSWSRDDIPPGQTSVIFNDDGTATGSLLPGKTYTVDVVLFNTADDFATRDTTFSVSAGSAPTISTQPASAAVTSGAAATLSVAATDTAPLSYQWSRGGRIIAGATSPSLSLGSIGSGETGIYDVLVSNGASGVLSTPVVLGVLPPAGAQTSGAVTTRPEWQDIHHPNGATYDQFLLTGAAGTFSADPDQIARCSYLDENNSIVQVEMSGAGAITINLDNPSGPMAPALYNQSGIQYMKGKATIILVGADQTTHFTIYSVGTATNPGVTRPDAAYAGWADIAVAGILSTNGGLGGIHQGNANYNATVGYTGLYAPNVTSVGGLVVVHGVTASADAVPYLYFGLNGSVSAKIAGSSLAQPNGDSITVRGLSKVTMGAGQDSCGRGAPAQQIATRLVTDAGTDVTASLVTGP